MSLLQTLQSECSTQVGNYNGPLLSEADVGAISTTDLLPNDNEPFDKDSFKIFLNLAKDYIADSAVDLKADLDLVKNNASNDL